MQPMSTVSQWSLLACAIFVTKISRRRLYASFFMSEFNLDPTLSQDCFLLKETKHSLVLLMNNSLYHWFIIVPKASAIEWFELDDEMQSAVMAEINELSRWMKSDLAVDKINIASIGNIVSQLHIHVVGRSSTDASWPAVVWGAKEKLSYTDEELKRVKARFESEIDFTGLSVR